VSHKSPRIAALIESCRGKEFDPHYHGFFECFNHRQFFEAHEVLEELWLAERGKERDLFYKGLIQLAGAFVHVQKKRPGPAAALFELARANLNRYAPVCDRLDLEAVLSLISDWLTRVRTPGADINALAEGEFPALRLQSAAA
jgi:predicted metal-dependent hydrolase